MTQRAIYAKTVDNVYQESAQPFFDGDVPVRYDDPEADEALREAERLAQEKLQMIKADIASLEAQITNRRMREAIVSKDYSFIEDIENKIKDKRKELV